MCRLNHALEEFRDLGMLEMRNNKCMARQGAVRTIDMGQLGVALIHDQHWAAVEVYTNWHAQFIAPPSSLRPLIGVVLPDGQTKPVRFIP